MQKYKLQFVTVKSATLEIQYTAIP